MSTTYRKDDLNQAFYALQLLSEHIPELKNMDPAIREMMVNPQEREKIRLQGVEDSPTNRSIRDKLINETIELITKTFTEAKRSLEASGNGSLLEHFGARQSPEEIAKELQDNPKRLAEMADIVNRLATASKGGAEETVRFVSPRTLPENSVSRIGHALLPSPAFRVKKYEAGQSSVRELAKEHYRFMLDFAQGSSEVSVKTLVSKLNAALSDYATVESGSKGDTPFICLLPKGEKFSTHELFAMADRAELASTFQYYRAITGNDGDQSSITRRR